MNGSIFGDADLYQRLRTVAAVLGCFVARRTRALDSGQIELRTAHPAAQVAAICETLCSMGVLKAVGESGPLWALARNRSELTLEDAFRCATLLQPARQGRKRHSQPQAKAAASPDIDNFLMQAVIEVDQSVLQLLRQFPLDRLGIEPADRMPAPQPHHLWQRGAGA